MVLSNAERQARYRQRIKSQADAGVTPADIRRACRLFYDLAAAELNEGWPPFDEWEAAQRRKKGGGGWSEMLPDDPDPKAYEGLSDEDAAFLAKVAAVVRATRFPA